MEAEMSNGKVSLRFAAIDKVLVKSIPSSDEGQTRGKGHVTWGSGDDYPNFLYQLYLDCPILETIINGTTDYVTGNGVHPIEGGLQYPNRKGETWESFLGKLACDYITFGVAYIQVIRDNVGRVSELYHLDSRMVRSDEDNEMFYYNKEFGKRYGRSSKTIIYPKFIAEAYDVPSSVICVKTPFSRGVYGTPMWGSAVKAVLAETEIDNFHLNELQNNFTASAVINFNNGQPTDEEADELESNIIEKLTGTENAGRFILSFNNGKDNATTIERLDTDNFDERYESLAKKTERQIFAAFGANPNLFGIATESNGFNSEEYESSFKLYNRCRVRPIQMRLIDAIDKAFGTKGYLTIDPFDLNNDTETDVR